MAINWGLALAETGKAAGKFRDERAQRQERLEDRLAQKEMRELQKRSLEQALARGPAEPTWDTRETESGEFVQIDPRTGQARRVMLDDVVVRAPKKAEPAPSFSFQTDKDGNVVGINPKNPQQVVKTGVQAPPKATSEPPQPADGERKAAAMLERIRGVNADLAQFDDEKALDALASRAGMLGNWATSAEGRRLRAAGRIWVMSVLRPESGATIGDKELDSYFQTYLPRPGDDAVTLAFKRRQREVAERAVEVQAGRALKSAASKQYTLPHQDY